MRVRSQLQYGSRRLISDAFHDAHEVHETRSKASQAFDVTHVDC